MGRRAVAAVESGLLRGCLAFAGVFKAGGTTEASTVAIQDCIAAAKLRCKEVSESLDATLSADG